MQVELRRALYLWDIEASYYNNRQCAGNVHIRIKPTAYILVCSANTHNPVFKSSIKITHSFNSALRKDGVFWGVFFVFISCLNLYVVIITSGVTPR